MATPVTADFLDGLQLPMYWSQDGDKPDPIVQCMLVDQVTGCVWYIIEGTRNGDDYRLYGFQHKALCCLPHKAGFRLSSIASPGLVCVVSVKGQKYSYARSQYENQIFIEECLRRSRSPN